MVATTILLISIAIALIAYNTPFFSGDDHGHGDHGHAAAPRPGALDYFDPWGIVFRLAASIATCSFLTGFSLACTGADVQVLGMARDVLAGIALKGLIGGVVTLGILVVVQLVMHWGSAVPQR